MVDGFLEIKMNGKTLKVPFSKILENRRWYIRKHDEVSEDFKHSPSELDRVIGALCVYPDADNPFRFRVLCPICGWLSKETSAFTRIRWVRTVTSILGRHLKRKHGFYEVIEKVGAGTHWEQVYRCKICGHMEARLWDILAHYLNNHFSGG